MMVMHTLACFWVKIGILYEGSWLDNPEDIRHINSKEQYLKALYWVVTTLTTVGYGDIKGNRTEEYLYNMFVEFVGILFFSFIMGSIQNIFMRDTSILDEIEQKIEEVDIWLVNLDKVKPSKTLPKLMYDNIRLYIRN